NDVTQIRARTHSPVLQHQACHHAEPVQREVPACKGKLSTRNMASLIQPALAILEGAEHEQVRALVKPRFAQPNSVHDPIAKCQFRHRLTSPSVRQSKRRDYPRPADRRENDCLDALPQLPLPGPIRQRRPELNARLGSSSAKDWEPLAPLVGDVSPLRPPSSIP